MHKADLMLKIHRRSLPHEPRRLLLGPTGRRLWAESLLPEPGFSGSMDFIHKMNLPLLFTVVCDSVSSYEPCDVQWYPSHLVIQYKGQYIHLEETKFITIDDCAVSLMVWTNVGEKPCLLTLKTPSETSFSSSHGYQAVVTVKTDAPSIRSGIALMPGETVRLTVAAGVGLNCENPVARRWASMIGAEAFHQHQSEYLRFFEQAPDFESTDPLLDKTWWYRWYILRHNLADPKHGMLNHAFFYEGRSHKMTKTPFSPNGWEFSKMIPLSVPMHLLDIRWHGDKRLGEETIRTMMDAQGPDGLYRCTYVDEQGAAYSNFFAWAVYQYLLITGDTRLASEVLPSLKRQAAGWKQAYGSGENRLMRETVHQLTGKEYQPSYWYFNQAGYPADPTDPKYVSHLLRVDKSVYHLMNLRGVAGVCRLVQDSEADLYDQEAELVDRDIRRLMWDDESKFFYDLHPTTLKKAMVKNIVGFYPYWAGIADGAMADGAKAVFSPLFQTGCPFPSVATDCEMFSPAGGWKGYFFKGRNGCVWNGPTWPYTNAVVLDGMAGEIRRGGGFPDGWWMNMFREYSFMHYENRNFNRPALYEHYNAITGESLSGEADYLHSYWIDLFLRQGAGLYPTQNSLAIEQPLAEGVDFSILCSLFHTPSQKELESPLFVTWAGHRVCAADHSIGPRMLTTYKVVMVVSGSGFFVLDGKNMLIRAGDLFFLFPDVKHHYFSNPQDPWTLKWFAFNGKSCKEFMASLRVNTGNPVMRDSTTRKLMNGMDGVIEGMKRESAYPFAVLGSAYLFFDELMHIRDNELAPSAEPMAEDAQLKKMLTFIDLNTTNDLSVEAVCRHLNYSRSHFSHFFKSKTGMSLPEYINMRRVERAKELLLSTDMNNAEIAMSVGYSEPMYFHRAFKKLTNMTPQHYRMENVLGHRKEMGEKQ